MSHTAYYLLQVLPIVFLFASIAWTLGLTFGWLLWGEYPERALNVEGQNQNLRSEIRRSKQGA